MEPSQYTSIILRALAIEMYKISNGFSSTFMVEIMNELYTLYHTRWSFEVEVIHGDIRFYKKIELVM